MNLLAKDIAVIGGREASWIALRKSEYDCKASPWTTIPSTQDIADDSVCAISLELGSFSTFGDFLLNVSGKRNNSEESHHEG